MHKPGGPELVLDRRASAPRTPNCPAASQTTPEGTPVRLAPSQSAQGAPRPSRTTPGPPFWWPALQLSPHLRGSFMLLRHERSRHTEKESRP